MPNENEMQQENRPTLRQLLDRTGEDTNVEVLTDLGDLRRGDILPLAVVRQSVPDEIGYTFIRTMRNWRIQLAASGKAVLRRHPWDETPNIAYVARGGPFKNEVMQSLLNEVDTVATRTQRLGLIGEAIALWRIAISIAMRTGQPFEVFREKAVKLQEGLLTGARSVEFKDRALRVQGACLALWNGRTMGMTAHPDESLNVDRVKLQAALDQIRGTDPERQARIIGEAFARGAFSPH